MSLWQLRPVGSGASLRDGHRTTQTNSFVYWPAALISTHISPGSIPRNNPEPVTSSPLHMLELHWDFPTAGGAVEHAPGMLCNDHKEMIQLGVCVGVCVGVCACACGCVHVRVRVCFLSCAQGNRLQNISFVIY